MLFIYAAEYNHTPQTCDVLWAKCLIQKLHKIGTVAVYTNFFIASNGQHFQNTLLGWSHKESGLITKLVDAAYETKRPQYHKLSRFPSPQTNQSTTCSDSVFHQILPVHQLYFFFTKTASASCTPPPFNLFRVHLKERPVGANLSEQDWPNKHPSWVLNIPIYQTN